MVRLAPPQATPSAPASADGLPLPLQRALNSLNVQVEQELARYRQSRRGEIPEARSSWMKGRQPLRLIPVPATAPKAVAPPPVAPPVITAIAPPPLEPTPTLGEPERVHEPRTAPFQTPLGVGLLLLLGVGGVGLGIAAANPATLSPLLARLAPYWPFGGNPSEVATTEAGETATEPEGTMAVTPPQPLEPDLSRQEFTPLDLSSLSTLPSRLATRPIPNSLPQESEAVPPETDGATAEIPDGPPAIAPAPATSAPVATPERLATATPRDRPSNSAPAPRVSPPAPPATAPQRPTAASTPRPTATLPDRLFYVVTDYTGDASLDQARQVVGDAYVRNFPSGARIQVGAFSSQGEANAAAERLQQDGLSVEVYQP